MPRPLARETFATSRNGAQAAIGGKFGVMTNSNTRWVGDAQNPTNWFESARKMNAAMDQLKPAMRDFWVSLKESAEDHSKGMPTLEYNSVYLMLAALVVENLCKGYTASHLTDHEKQLLDKGQWPGRLNRNHNIRVLLKDVGFEPTAQEQEIVSRIQEAINWRGRYPLPKDPKNLPPFWSISGCDDLLVDALIKRLVRHVIPE